jgi:PST family polysaccharide transporter
MWVAAQAGVTRIITFVQQIVLGWLLAKSDFGLIGLTYTVTAIVQLMANPGIDAVLVQRLRRYRHWATPAFWLGITMGSVGAILMLAVAPVAGWIYGRPQLIGMIAVVATALPIQALQIVPKAQLQMQMRFRAIVLLGLLTSFLTATLTISGAYLGMGAYSFVVPIPIVAAIIAAATWRLARPPILCRWEFARWQYLFGKSMTVGTTQLLNTFMNQADYMALGVAGVAETSIGAYVYAFNIAIQPLRLISSNVPVVLFPGLSQLTLEPEKQLRAMQRAMRLLMLVTVPVCLLQVLFAPPIFRLILPPTWAEAVLPCQLLTIGLMINAACWPATSLLMAQGQFRRQLWATIAGTALFVTLVGMAAWWYASIVAVAAAVALFHTINSPFLYWVATERSAPRWTYIANCGPPLMAGSVAAIPCAVLQWNLPASWTGDVIALIAGGVLFLAAYALVAYWIVPPWIADLIQQLLPLWHRIRGTQTAEDVAREAVVDAAAVEAAVAGDGFVAPEDLPLPKVAADPQQLS